MYNDDNNNNNGNNSDDNNKEDSNDINGVLAIFWGKHSYEACRNLFWIVINYKQVFHNIFVKKNLSILGIILTPVFHMQVQCQWQWLTISETELFLKMHSLG